MSTKIKWRRFIPNQEWKGETLLVKYAFRIIKEKKLWQLTCLRGLELGIHGNFEKLPSAKKYAQILVDKWEGENE